ncbi:hypothetical protein FRC00_013438, partial [Tulasnella sp. 408]
ALQGNKLWECWICNVKQGKKPPFDSYEFHENTFKHRTRVAALAASSATQQQDDEEHRCELCNVDVPAQLWSAHFNSVSHKRKEKFIVYDTALKDAEKDKGGVVVQEKELDFGTVELATLETQPTRVKTFTITAQRKVKLREARVTSSIGTYAHLRESKLNTAIKIGAGGKFGLKVDFDPKGNRGHYDDRLELIFEDTAAHTRFFIVRPLHAIVAVQADLDLLAPTAPYQKPKPRPKETETAVIEGPRPPQLAKISWVKPLWDEDVPTFLKVLVEDGTVGEKIRALQAEMLPAEVNAKTYVSVPGLAEKRPSVIVGDRIKVRNHKQRTEHWFRGFVHVVEQLQVGLKFAPSFNSFRGQKYDVRFELNRLTLRRMHQ